jgi:hypothetical protein
MDTVVIGGEVAEWGISVTRKSIRIQHILYRSIINLVLNSASA